MLQSVAIYLPLQCITTEAPERPAIVPHVRGIDASEANLVRLRAIQLLVGHALSYTTN